MKKNLSKALLTFSTLAVLLGFASPSVFNASSPLYGIKVDIDVH
ncbi:hypothetical protein [Macrococcus brunensis]|nr:hypothetical protein [Macrococcus brunensis]